MNQFGTRPGIILLREGTDSSQGKPQLISNMNACQAVADTIRTTLGPCGLDKLVVSGGRTTISNDGATILQLLEIAHPAAKSLVDISRSQDAVVGDGTTSVVLLAAEILKWCKPLVEESNLHPRLIIKYLRAASKYSLECLERVAIRPTTPEDERKVLLQCASTALNSKLIASHLDLFGPMVVDAVLNLQRNVVSKDGDNETNKEAFANDDYLNQMRKWIGIHKVPGGDVRQSFFLEDGVAFSKTFSYAGFEQMTKYFEKPKILLLKVELELKAEKENAEVRIDNPSDYTDIVQAEWDVIYEKLDLCIASGVNIVLSELPIGDLGTQYFCDAGLFCAGRVPSEDLTRIAMATGAVLQTTCRGLTADVLGTCEVFEEVSLGEERLNLMRKCPNPLVSTIVLRGGSEQFIAESERSLHDALMVVRRLLLSTPQVVAGAGSIEALVSAQMKRWALTKAAGKEQLIMEAYAKALEVIPRQLCHNAGLDATLVMAQLRQAHASTTGICNEKEVCELGDAAASNNCWMGIDTNRDGICDAYEAGIWEPLQNKINSWMAATEAACLILSIDETIISPRSQDPALQQTGQLPAMGGGGGMMGLGSDPMGSAMDAVNAQQGGSRSGNLGNGVSYMKGRG
mmetsp:Transcript_3228/g.4893  ORF Transcript_3228/g.4893 Transcript_3228/m.4893 type:complete len:630 (-) Transcript_3228:55-1944(-)